MATKAKEALAKELNKLYKSQTELKEQLTIITKNIASKEKETIEEFGVGSHKAGKLVVFIEENTTKGKATPSWKSITEDVLLSVAEIKDYLIKKDYDKKTADRFCARLLKDYDKHKLNHTKISEDKITHKIIISKPS